MGFDPNKPAEVIAESQAAPVMVQVPEVPETPVLTPEERLQNALEKIRSYRVHVEGFCMPEGHYKDFCGEDSSAHFWSNLVSAAQLLKMPIRLRENRWLSLESEFYNVRTGVWSYKGQALTIQELKHLIDLRISELGISKVKVWEYMAALHPVEEDLAYHRLSFEKQMDTFREQAA